MLQHQPFLQNKNNLTGTGTDLGKSYMAFCRGNMDQIEKKIKDDLWVLNTMEVRRLRLYYGERQLASNFESFSAMVC